MAWVGHIDEGIKEFLTVRVCKSIFMPIIWIGCSLIPRLLVGGERESLVSTVWEIVNHRVLSVQPWRHNVNLPLHRPHIFYQQWKRFDRSLSCALHLPPTGSYFWCESQKSTVAIRFDFCWEKDVFIRLLPGKSVWYHRVTVCHRL